MRVLPSRSASFALLSIVAVACGCGGNVSTTTDDGGVTADEGTNGDGSSSGDGASTDDASGSDGTTTVDTGLVTDTAVQDTYCARLQERATKCGSSFDLGDCLRRFACYMAVMIPEDRTPFFECLATRDCMTSDDTCVAKVAGKYASDPAIQAYTRTCLDKRTACQASGASFADDYCGYDHGMLKPEVRTQLTTCLMKDCPAVKGCLDNVYKVYGCGG